MDFLEEIKKKSSKWMKTKGEQYQDFYWQDGYGIFSVSPREVTHLEDYIARQKEHHSMLSYQDECLRLFRRHGVRWDEKYVWGLRLACRWALPIAK